MLATHDDQGVVTPSLDAALCVDSARDALVALDADGLVVVWSAGAQRMYGWRADEVIGAPLPWTRGGRHGAEHEEVHALARRGVVVGAVPIETSRRNGSTLLVEVSTDPVRDATGRIIGTCSIHRDVDRRGSLALASALDRTIDLTDDHHGAPDAGHGFDGLCARHDLNEIERDLVALLLTGHRIPAMARTLGRSPGTIRNRLSILYRKFGVGGQIELLEMLHRELGSEPMGPDAR